jgi:tRNA(fMet)-specific endonuclease VapC
MPPRFMLDTDTCIYIRRNKPPRVTERFAALVAGEAVVSVVSYGELRVGAEKSRWRERDLAVLEKLIAIIPVEPLPAAAADVYGSIRAELERRGEVIGNNDLWIAAHARASGLTLVTNNEREFRRVPGLQVENWVAGA